MSYRIYSNRLRTGRETLHRISLGPISLRIINYCLSGGPVIVSCHRWWLKSLIHYRRHIWIFFIFSKPLFGVINESYSVLIWGTTAIFYNVWVSPWAIWWVVYDRWLFSRRATHFFRRGWFGAYVPARSWLTSPKISIVTLPSTIMEYVGFTTLAVSIVIIQCYVLSSINSEISWILTVHFLVPKMLK